MSRARAIAVLIVLIAATMIPAAPLFAETSSTGPRIHGGFVTGNQYRDMTGIQKRSYVAGLLDGMLLAPAFGGSEDRMQWFLVCTRRLGVIKLRGAINTYIRDHDESHYRKSAADMYRAIRAACRSLVTEPKRD
jgi:hypothetical protein